MDFRELVATKKRTHWKAVIAAVATVLTCPYCSRADKAPLNPEQLSKQARLIIEGVVTDLDISKAAPHLDGGRADTDWAIKLTLRVNQVRQGNYTEPSLTLGCFRLRTRTSAYGFMTVTGHHPIPPFGARVVVYAERAGGNWRPLIPNGIQPLDPEQTLSDAAEVTSLPAPTFTFLLSLEMWTLLAVVLSGALIVRWSVRRRRKPTESAGTEPHPQ